jgi:hypothetical protein
MRDFRDAKAMARTLRQALAAKGVTITNSESLELIAKALGAKDWNTLAAMIQAAEPVEAATPRPSPSPASPPSTGQRFSPELEASLHRAVALAVERKHQYTTLEHLLAALVEDADAATVMRACQVDLPALRQILTGYLDNELTSLVWDGAETAGPTAGFHRVVQRAVIHVQSAGPYPVTGANLLLAIFSERESHAAAFLAQHGLNRYDAVNFIANGVVKPEGPAA